MRKNINLANKILIVLYLLVFTVSENQTMDRMAPQIFVLSILNVFSMLYLYFTHQILKIDERIKMLIKVPSYQVILLIAIIFISILFSFLFSINIVESIIAANNIFQVLITIFVLIFLLKSIKSLKIFSFSLILFILFLESLLVFYQIIDYYLTYDVFGKFGRTFEIRGFTGNINITAFSIAYKLPFLIYIIDKESRLFRLVILNIILFISSIDLFHLSSRGAILSLLLIASSYPIYILVKKGSKKRILPVILMILLATLTTNYFAGNNRVNERVKTISISTEDGSIDQRFRFYKQVISYFTENPFKPIGVGMYKLKSIQLDKNDITKYIVPGHAHNDFLEILIELGFIAFLSYLFIYIILFKLVFKNFFFKESSIFYPIALFLIIYFIDSNLNFPLTRPVSFIFFSFIVSLTLNLDESNA